MMSSGRSFCSVGVININDEIRGGHTIIVVEHEGLVGRHNVTATEQECVVVGWVRQKSSSNSDSDTGKERAKTFSFSSVIIIVSS